MDGEYRRTNTKFEFVINIHVTQKFVSDSDEQLLTIKYLMTNNALKNSLLSGMP